MHKTKSKNKERRVIIIDLDDTLIDTYSFKNIIFDKLALESGLTKKEIEEIYQEIKRKGNKNLLSTFCLEIGSKSNKNKNIFEKAILSAVKTIKINKEVLNFVKKTKGDKILLTQGETKFQKAKIEFLKEKTKIDKILSDIVITKNGKAQFISSKIKRNKFIFKGKSYNTIAILDDKLDLFSGLRMYPFIKLIHPKEIE
jgi:beta-phosphoglucomutase-like phosphatase (HAD superfamily)